MKNKTLLLSVLSVGLLVFVQIFFLPNNAYADRWFPATPQDILSGISASTSSNLRSNYNYNPDRTFNLKISCNRSVLRNCSIKGNSNWTATWKCAGSGTGNHYHATTYISKVGASSPSINTSTSAGSAKLVAYASSTAYTHSDDQNMFDSSKSELKSDGYQDAYSYVYFTAVHYYTLSGKAVDTNGKLLDGHHPGDTEVEAGSSASVTKKDITGYVFLGWASANTNEKRSALDLGTKSSYSISSIGGDKTVYAVYRKVYYTLSGRAVDTNGTLLSGHHPEDTKVEAGSSASITKKDITDYVFLGWASANTNEKRSALDLGTKSSYSISSISGNKKVYAVYRKVHYTLSGKAVDTNGKLLDGHHPGDTEVEAGSSASVTKKDITGYVFLGWASANTNKKRSALDLGTKSSYSISSISGNKTVYAVYREARAYVGLTTKIYSNVVKNLTNPSSNQSEESEIDKGTTSASIAIGDDDKIFMDSSANNSTKKATISFDYTLTRGVPNSKYDLNIKLSANYTLNDVAGSVSLDYKNGSETVSDKYTLCNGSGSGCNEVIPLGTYDKQVCRVMTTNGVYMLGGGTSTGNTTLTSTACAHVYRPYNFSLTPSVSSDNTEASYVGGEVDVHIKIDNNTNDDESQEGTHSYSPEGTQIKVFRFIVSKNTSISDVDGKLSGGTTNSGDICTFYQKKLGKAYKKESNSCADLTDQLDDKRKDIKDGKAAKGIATGALSLDITDTIPTNFEVGDKVCYAVAVNYVSSSYINNGNGAGYGSASLAANKWIISNASCQTTAKRPTFQVLGGSVFAEGSINGAVTKALAGNSYKAFGSWVDFGIISNSEVTKVASSASLAKGKSLSESDSSVDFCTYSPLTVANRDCNNGGENLGDAKININTTTLNTILNRYANNTIAKKIKRNSINVSSDYTSFSDKYFSVATEDKTKYRYTYIDGNTKITASSALPKGTTQVIYSTGKITIDGNLTYQDTGLKTIDDIPQYIIIAEGGITINGGVTRVDAWLVTPNSTINTCGDKEIGTVTLSGDVCENKLEVNGPVFANNLLLYRTHGAEPTNPSEPAEVFDISAATYFWAHNQSIADSNQANTVYSRRMAPRE